MPALFTPRISYVDLNDVVYIHPMIYITQVTLDLRGIRVECDALVGAQKLETQSLAMQVH